MSSKRDKGIQHYASVNNPSIEAAIHGLYRFETPKQAMDRLNTIRAHFTLSKHQLEDAEGEWSAVLWIRGYEVTPEEEAEGYLGNYAMIRGIKAPEGHYTLVTEKMPVESKKHPQRKQKKHPYPNWGHPILRAVKKGRVYETLEDIRAELTQLHSEYPETTIPGLNKLFLMIHGKPPREDLVAKGKVNKYLLKIEKTKNENPGFVLAISLKV